MIANCKKYWLVWFTLLLFVAVIFLFHLDWRESHRGFTFAMLDVGQGDALFIESPTGTQILVDGGPPRKILSQLARVMSPFDRHIDAMIITNPDQDHIAGFLDVLRVYKVDQVFESGTFNDSKVYQNLKDEIKQKNIPDIFARKGMKLDIGGDAVIEILFPDRDVSFFSPNDGSVVARLSYGAHSFMLMGDTTSWTEKNILQNDKMKNLNLKSEVLKVGHHGSRTSTSEDFVKAVSPDYALISNGKENRYGHPHRETLDTLAQYGAKIFRTDQDGAIIFKCDRIDPCAIKKLKN